MAWHWETAWLWVKAALVFVAKQWCFLAGCKQFTEHKQTRSFCEHYDVTQTTSLFYTSKDKNKVALPLSKYQTSPSQLIQVTVAFFFFFLNNTQSWANWTALEPKQNELKLKSYNSFLTPSYWNPLSVPCNVCSISLQWLLKSKLFNLHVWSDGIWLNYIDIFYSYWLAFSRKICPFSPMYLFIQSLVFICMDTWRFISLLGLQSISIFIILLNMCHLWSLGALSGWFCALFFFFK